MSMDLLIKLNPKAVSFLPGGGNAKYDRDDVISALAPLPALPTAYAFALVEAHNNDQKIKTNLATLQVHFAAKLFGILLKDEFKPRKVTQIAFADGVVRATLQAHFFATSQCKTCQGVGSSLKATGIQTDDKKQLNHVAMKPVICIDCMGKGVRPLNDVEKCRLAFPSVAFDASWWRKYARKYAQIIEDGLNELHSMVDQALYEMKRALIKEANSV